MRVLLYHKEMNGTPKPVLDRASHRQHMLHKTLLWDVVLFVVLSISGPLAHYYAPLLCRIPVLAVFVPVNESVWEHMKLLFFPALLIGGIRYLWTGELQKGIMTTFASGLWRAMLLMVCLYYSISGISGSILLWMDITLYYVGVIFLTLYVRIHATGQKKSSLPGMVFLLLMTGCFIRFTYCPPDLGIFAY